MPAEPRDVTAALRDWLHNRAVLAQATGVLMVRRDCTGAEAWAYLHGTADQTGVPVADLAGQIVASIESTA